MRLRLGVSAQGQKTYLTPQRLGRCCVPSEAGTYRGLRCAFVAAHCIAHFLLPDPQPHPIILITRVDTRATDIMVMTGKRSGLDSAVRAGCPNGGISDKARSLVRYLVGNGGDTMHNMDVRNYDHDLPYKFGMSEDVGYDSDLQAANVHREALQKPLLPSRMEQKCSVQFFLTTPGGAVFFTNIIVKYYYDHIHNLVILWKSCSMAN